MFTAPDEKINSALEPFRHGDTFRFRDLIPYFEIEREVAEKIERVLTRKRGTGSLPYGYRCGAHVLVEGTAFLRVYDAVTSTSERSSGGAQ